MSYKYIAIEGNIGAGKTTLTRMLAEHFNANIVLEEFADNPFLEGFYSNPEKFAFPVETFFLAERFKQLSSLKVGGDLFAPFTVSDYFIFKSLIFAQETLNSTEFDLYKRIFEILVGQLPKPDLLIYLYNTPDQLKRNIIKRGRSYEQDIDFTYLDRIQQGYLRYFSNVYSFPVIILDTANLDFVKNRTDFELILKLLDQNYPNGRKFITF
ncbi:MAG: deoxynucleoside kinase [Luteibaculaceae bacterium]